EEASELEAGRNRLLAPRVAVVQHAIGADGVGLRRPRARRLVLRDLAVLNWKNRLAGLAIYDEEHAVGAHRGDELPVAAGNLRVQDDRRHRDVGFPDVVLDRLVVPLQLAGLDVERDERAEIEVGARALVARVLRDAVARAEVDEAELGIR